MADFCTTCAERFGMIADIDLTKLSSKLKLGEEIRFLCEGCEMIALLKDKQGQVFRGYYEPGGIRWIKELDGLV